MAPRLPVITKAIARNLNKDYGTLPSSILTLTPKFWHLCFPELFALEAKWVKKKMNNMATAQHRDLSSQPAGKANQRAIGCT